MGSSRILACAGMALCLLSTPGCGREASPSSEPRRDRSTREALDALRGEMARLRREVTALRAHREARVDEPISLVIELTDAGRRDPFLAERSNEMNAIARRWGEDGSRAEIERRIAALREQGHAGVAGIVPFLRDASSDRRLAALYVLRELGVAAELAVPQIKERLNDPDAAVRAAAEDALCAIHDRPR